MPPRKKQKKQKKADDSAFNYQLKEGYHFYDMDTGEEIDKEVLIKMTKDGRCKFQGIYADGTTIQWGQHT